MKQNTKRRGVSLLLALAMCLSGFMGPASPHVLAASGETGTVTFRHSYDADGNDIRYNSSAVFGGYTAGGAGEIHYRVYVDGNTGYCIQPGVPLLTGDRLKKDASATWDALSEGQKKAAGLALLYGYQGNRGHLPGTDGEKWAATQILVWEFVTGCRNEDAPYAQESRAMYDMNFGSHYPNRGVKKAYEQILSEMAAYGTLPSFLQGSHALAWQEGNYTLTLTDTNGVLEDYDVYCPDRGITITKAGNSLTLTAAQPLSGKVHIAVSRNNIPIVGESARIIAYGDDSLQDLITGVENAEPVTGILEVETPTGSLAVKKESEDGVVAGLAFTVSGNGLTQTATTDASGEWRLDGLVPGVYTVTEQAYDRYEPQEVRRVTVIGGETATVAFYNTLKRGGLSVTKTSEDGLNGGIKFHLSGTSLSGIPVDEYALTDSGGTAVFRGLPIGSGYVLEEVDTAERYVAPDSQGAAVEWGTVTHRAFDNRLKKWSAAVTKRDAETGVAQGNASLAGAVYGVYQGGQLIDSYTTDAAGQFTTKEYVCGKDWSLCEISPSEGYLLDETVYPIGAEPSLYEVEHNLLSQEVAERAAKGKIAIIKHTDNGDTRLETPEAGAEFSVYLKSAGSYEAAKDTERGLLLCDENGYAETGLLPYGIYTVHQTKGWAGRELLPDFDVYVATDGQVYRYLANNRGFESHIKIIKTDAETGKTIPYAGAGFQLYRPDGSRVEMTLTYPRVTAVDTFYTNAEGYLVTPEALEYGSGYSLKEVAAPYGYVLDPEPVYFDVAAAHAGQDHGATVVEVTKPDTAQKGVIRIKKTGEVFASVTENGGIYQPVYAMRGLPGAAYEISAAQDVVTPDGTLRYGAGEVVDTVTTDETGTARSRPLYLGRYSLREITAPAGMALDPQPHELELAYAGQEIEVTEAASEFYNERKKAALTLEKSLEQDPVFGIGSSGEWSAVSFGLYAEREVAAADGTAIPADGLLEIVAVDENGHGACRTDLPFGSYYLKEISTDSHYLLSGQKYPIAFSCPEQDTALAALPANNGEPIFNALLYGTVKGIKKDDSGNPLKDAQIGLFPAGCTEFTQGKALLTAVSGSDGGFSFPKVPYGDWTVREIEAPEGYVLSGQAIPVTIDGDGAVVGVEIEDTRIRGTVQLTKTDRDYPDRKLAGAEFDLYRDSNGSQNLDSGDGLLGQLSEVSAGIYEMADLPYGGYFVRESKAPEGFCLDGGIYYFEILEQGETVTVENGGAGRGFGNAPQTGSLKILKTASDHKVEGLSFRVAGPGNYEEVFTTDKNGEILMENLRIGEYTVSEVPDSASSAYVLPADKAALVLAGSVTMVEMHNELQDTPKTGDERNPAFWLALLGIAGAVAAACGVLASQKKKKKGEG